MFKDERSYRFTFLGLIAWVSICLLFAGWGQLETGHVRILSFAGRFGLIAAVGLSESLRSESSLRFAKLMASSTTDHLTGVGNRRCLDAEIERRIAQLRRQGTTVSLLMIDVDHFKILNDNFGHLAGDAMLRNLAMLLDKTLRDTDLITRYGGEEFVAVLPGTDLHHARLAGERIRHAIEQSRVNFNDQELNVTISVGITEALSNDTSDSFLNRADQALYEAKNAGRNCCFFRIGEEQGQAIRRGSGRAHSMRASSRLGRLTGLFLHIFSCGAVAFVSHGCNPRSNVLIEANECRTIVLNCC